MNAPVPDNTDPAMSGIDSLAGGTPAAASGAPRRSWAAWWSPRNIGAVYIWALIIIVFSIISPDKFMTLQTLKDVLNQNATTGLAALILIVPLASGALDLSIGAVMGMGGILVAKLLGYGWPIWLAVVVTLLLCAVLGLVNSAVVVGMNVNALIGTLATASVFAAVMSAISGDKILTKGMQGGFKRIAQGSFHGITMPVLYIVLLAILLHLGLERAPLGRKVYATGFNESTARLVGIPVTAIKIGSMVVGAVVSGFAGVVSASRVQAAMPNDGFSVLMPAVSAAFLGATQLRGGRFNPFGTLVAVFMLGTGSLGLILAGAPQWSPQVFNGVVLILAVGLTVAKRGGRGISLGGM